METIYEHPVFKDIIERQEAIMAAQIKRTSDPSYKPAVQRHNAWVFDVPPANTRAHKLLLLTIGGIGVNAVWDGGYGQHYVAYAVDKSDQPILPQ